MKTSFSALPAPERLGRYVLFHEIGRGGMGTVYLARTRSSLRGYRRLVALKRLHGHLAGDEPLRQMFLDEVRLISQLSHPNTAPAVDFGEENDTVWLTMPLVLGESLDRVIAALHLAEPALRARLPELTAHILVEACEGLHAAHELRDDQELSLEVVHRDVTPRNVIVGYDGVTRVIDFGIASALHRLHRTSTGELKGTPAYAAPEHIQGLAVDRRADIWSLGVLGWEMCTGRRLFAGSEPAQVLDRVLHAAIEGPRESNANIPLGLDEALLKALNRNRERRYTTAREMGRELLLFMSEQQASVGAADVADCMEALFPGEHAARRNLVAEVRTRELPKSESSSRGKQRGLAPAWQLLVAGGLGALGALGLRWLLDR